MQSKTALLILCAIHTCSTSLCLRAQGDAGEPNGDRIETISELGKLYGEVRGLNDVLLYEMKLVADQKNTEGVKAVFARKEREYESRFARLMELAVAAPDTALARDAAILTLNTTYGDERDTAIDLLLKYHIESHRMDEAVTCLGYTSRSTDICRKVLSANDDVSVRAHARFQIASKNWQASDDARREAKADLWNIVKTGEDITFHEGGRWGPNQTTKSLSFVASHVLKRIAGNESVKLGEPIQVFQGESLDGSNVSIADYKGKVTLIVFWATWCGPCLKMAELETHLVDRYKDMPFDILGICGDDEVTDGVKQVAANHGMTWTSIHNVLPDGTRLSECLGAPAWPYCILLDRDGIVQQTAFPLGVTNDPESQTVAFQDAIEQLLPEFEHPGK